MILGLDTLALGHKKWPVQLTIRQTPRGWALGCFDTTFGDVYPALIKCLRSRKFPAVRVHLWWHNDHRIAPVDVVKAGARKYEKLAKMFPNVTVYLSHSCEHKERRLSRVRENMDIIKHLAPSCVPVNTIWTGATVPGELNEVHLGQRVGSPWGCSTDGKNTFDMDARKYIRGARRAEYCFLWGHLFNMRESYDGPPPKPKDRTAIPDAKYFKSLVKLAERPGRPPRRRFRGQVRRIAEPLLYKSHAEDHEGGDPRGNKPLVILPTDADNIIVVDRHGEKITETPYYGGFHGGMGRYYFPSLYGYEIAKRAEKKSGSPYVWLHGAGVYWGPVHPTFRQGYFR